MTTAWVLLAFSVWFLAAVLLAPFIGRCLSDPCDCDKPAGTPALEGAELDGQFFGIIDREFSR